MTRPSYSAELWTALTFPVVVGLTEGSVAGVLAKRMFDVGPFLFALIMASGVLSNISSFLWARLARGRKKVKVITVLMTLSLCSLAGIALLPVSPLGGLLLTGLILLIRALLAGVVTLRSIVWRQNYPRAVRASITGRLAVCASLVIAFIPLLGYLLMDYRPEAFRILYPAGALFAGLGVWSFSRVRIRGEKQLLEYEQKPNVKPVAHGGRPAPVYEYDPEETKPTFWSVLKEDILYRRYMIAQFILGMANISSLTVFVYSVEELTRGMGNSFFISILLTAGLPFFMATCTLPAWARLLDRVHIATFRVTQVWMFIAYQVLAWWGVYTGQLLFLFGSAFFIGLARGGAILAWQLGHNDFANRRMVSLYMGIHVTLTGVRGAIAPFLGILLYQGYKSFSLGPISIPGFAGIEDQVFLLAALGNILAMILFYRLSRDITKTEPSSSAT